MSEELLETVIEYLIISILYGAIIFIAAKAMVYIEVKKVRAKIDVENDLHKYLKPMYDYIRVKGIDDFVFDCKHNQQKGHISIEARAMLKERYKALGDLGANGERDSAWKAVKDLPIVQETEEK